MGLMVPWWVMAIGMIASGVAGYWLRDVLERIESWDHHPYPADNDDGPYTD